MGGSEEGEGGAGTAGEGGREGEGLVGVGMAGIWHCAEEGAGGAGHVAEAVEGKGTCTVGRRTRTCSHTSCRRRS